MQYEICDEYGGFKVLQIFIQSTKLTDAAKDQLKQFGTEIIFEENRILLTIKSDENPGEIMKKIFGEE